MPSASQSREKLIKFLDQKVFDPILNTAEQQYETEGEKHKLRDLRARTKRDKRRYHEEHRTAEAVRTAFLSDLDAADAKVSRDLERLQLAPSPALRDEFLALCESLDVR